MIGAQKTMKNHIISMAWKILVKIFPFFSQAALNINHPVQQSKKPLKTSSTLSIDPKLLAKLEDSLLESAPFGLCVVQGNRIIVWNHALTKISGTHSEPMIGKSITQIAPSWQTLIQYVIQSHNKDIYRYSMHTEEYSRWFNCHKTSLYDDEGLLYTLILIEDVSQVEHLQKQANTNERMLSLGRVASRVAEEVNRPMSAIAFTAQNLMRQNLSSEQQNALQEIFNQTLRVKNALEQLSDYANPELNQPHQVIALKKLIQNAIHVLSIPERQIQLEVPDTIQLVVEPEHFQQLIAKQDIFKSKLNLKMNDMFYTSRIMAVVFLESI